MVGDVEIQGGVKLPSYWNMEDVPRICLLYHIVHAQAERKVDMLTDPLLLLHPRLLTAGLVLRYLIACRVGDACGTTGGVLCAEELEALLVVLAVLWEHDSLVDEVHEAAEKEVQCDGSRVSMRDLAVPFWFQGTFSQLSGIGQLLGLGLPIPKSSTHT